MGGSAIKEVFTRRYSADEYYAIEKVVLKKIRSVLPNSKVNSIKAFANKESFGDLDVLIENKHSKLDIEKFFHEWGITEVVKSSNVWSVAWGNFQVDLIFSSPQFFDATLSYFAYNDMGSLLGRVARNIGFKLGHKGLTYVLASKTNLLADINVTTDYKKALEFLDYDMERYNLGFDDLVDIFYYVTRSMYFEPSIFALENRNHDARKRYAKRPNYNAFLKYLEVNEPSAPAPVIDKDLMLQRAKDEFPEFKYKYDNVSREMEIAELVKSKFNGDIVTNITGLIYQDLGKVLVKSRKTFDRSKYKSFGEFILDSDEEEIKNFILEIQKEITL